MSVRETLQARLAELHPSMLDTTATDPAEVLPSPQVITAVYSDAGAAPLSLVNDASVPDALLPSVLVNEPADAVMSA